MTTNRSIPEQNSHQAPQGERSGSPEAMNHSADRRVLDAQLIDNRQRIATELGVTVGQLHDMSPGEIAARRSAQPQIQEGAEQ